MTVANVAMTVKALLNAEVRLEIKGYGRGRRVKISRRLTLERKRLARREVSTYLNGPINRSFFIGSISG